MSCMANCRMQDCKGELALDCKLSQTVVEHVGDVLNPVFGVLAIHSKKGPGGDAPVGKSTCTVGGPRNPR